jgi:hypothetical protein
LLPLYLYLLLNSEQDTGICLFLALSATMLVAQHKVRLSRYNAEPMHEYLNKTCRYHGSGSSSWCMENHSRKGLWCMLKHESALIKYLLLLPSPPLNMSTWNSKELNLQLLFYSQKPTFRKESQVASFPFFLVLRACHSVSLISLR